MNIYKYPTERPNLIVIFPDNFDENDKKIAVGKIVKTEKMLSIPNIDDLDLILEVTNGTIEFNENIIGIGKEKSSILVKNKDYNEYNIKSITEEANFQISYLKKEDSK